ncbi:hypothetical protein [Erythrobacter sp.]|jgi:hypothetical protein|uniref:hypothetical protein n=1 Tax=Erythrobacter sp. TaxID=1042 RepID=UPI002EC760E9|nr:hypothetical protein [Erythrobacter sp.]
MAHRAKWIGLAGLIAATSLPATGAHAAQMPATGTIGYATSVHSALAQGNATGPGGGFSSSSYDAKADTANWRGRWGWRRGWGRGGWGRGWRGGWRRHRGIRGGDILAGAIILGGIAAVASAANNRRRDRDVVIVERDRVRDRDYDYRPERRNTRRSTDSGSGIDNAVSRCLNEIERDVRVDSVDGASRVARGWIVTGTLFNGEGFACEIDNSGRVSDINYTGFAEAAPSGAFASAERAPAGNQWSADRYASARASMESAPYDGLAAPDAAPGAIDGDLAHADDASAEPLPAYPGGPLPGEEFAE